MILQKSAQIKSVSKSTSIAIFIAGLFIIVFFREFLIFVHLPTSLSTFVFWGILLLIPIVKRPVVFGLIFCKTAISLHALISNYTPGNLNGIVSNIANCIAAIIFSELFYHIINGLRDMNVKLNIESERAHEAAKAKAAFLANMSHEIRTPLSGIRGVTEMLLTDNTTTVENKENLEMIKSSTDTLLHIVNNVLNFSRIEAGKEDISESIVPITKMVRNFVDFMNTSKKSKNISLVLHIENSVPHHILTDEMKISQILTNLISNGIKFTDEGFVALTLSYDNFESEQLTITVKDTGMGIPHEKLDLIFTEFERVQTSYEKSREGTGLGLAITKGLVNKLGGTIQVSSELNKGAEFKVTIPVKSVSVEEPTTVTTQQESRTQLPEGHIGKSILLAEDNRVNQIYIKHFLEKQGYNLTIVENGEEAVNSFKNEQFNLILMDIQMPIKSGVQATKEIREHEVSNSLTKTPILALTASVTEDEQRLFLSSGMDEICPKPIDMQHLFKTMKFHLSNSNLVH